MANVDSIRALIEKAFAGVRLEEGVSLKEAQAYDVNLEGISDAEFKALAGNEETVDWRAIPLAALDDNPCLPFLDAMGFRYYMPALMLSLIDHYDPSSMRVIGTISLLDPRGRDSAVYSIISNKQKHAIATFLKNLPYLVELDHEGGKVVERALRDYWIRYIPVANKGDT